MSVTSLMSEEVKRRKSAVAAAGTIQPLQDSSATNALKALEKYIPTEVLALYVPAIAIAPGYSVCARP